MEFLLAGAALSPWAIVAIVFVLILFALDD